MKTSYVIFCFLIYLAIPSFTFAQTLSGVFNLVNKNSNLCLAVSNASTLPGEETIQWSCDGGADKAWELTNIGGSVYKIQNQKSFLYLKLKSLSRSNGEKATQGVADDPQIINWLFVDAGNGYYKIQNLYSGLFLAVGGGSVEQGGAIIQWTDHGQQDLLWRVVPTSVANKSKAIDLNGVKRVRTSVNPSLPDRMINFPGGGVRNNNQYVGDFCCTGETASILDNTNTTVGYVYFFSGRNPAYNTANGAVMGDLEILLSGAKEFGNPQALREKGNIYFANGTIYAGAQIMTTIGRILYTVKVLDVKFEVVNGRYTGRFYMNSIKVSVLAQAAY